MARPMLSVSSAMLSLTKPVDPEALFEVVERSATGATPARAEPVEGAIDRTDLLARLSGDQDLAAEVIALFFEDYPARLAAIKRAVEARDREGIRTAAHALKSAAATLSARGVAEAARQLEQIGASGDLDHVAAAWPRLQAAAERLLITLGAEFSHGIGPPCPEAAMVEVYSEQETRA